MKREQRVAKSPFWYILKKKECREYVKAAAVNQNVTQNKSGNKALTQIEAT